LRNRPEAQVFRISGVEAQSDEEAEKLFFEKMRPLSLIRRFIEADEIGPMVAFLASPLRAVTNRAA
jgi:NAD(P)-dependent dehydrogenase (short-subunit alcohol dehydrogenase family)